MPASVSLSDMKVLTSGTGFTGSAMRGTYRVRRNGQARSAISP